MRRLPPQSFDVYLAQGPQRSYESVAREFGCSKRSVLRRARKEHWQERIAEVERTAQASATTKHRAALEQEAERRVKVLLFLEGKAIEALQATPISSVSDAIRALDVVFRNRRPTPSESKAEEPRHVINVLQVSPEALERRKRRLNAAALLQTDPGSYDNPNLLEILRESDLS